MPAPLFPQTQQPRSLGVLNPVRSRALDASRFGGVNNGQPQAFAPRVVAPLIPPAPTVGAVATGATPQNVLQPVQPPDLRNVDPSSFQAQNTLANAGIYTPGSFGAQNAAANGTGYKPPQQTERANPLTGDNNIPMESTSTRVAAPFVQRGRATPAGQDVAPRPAAVAPMAAPAAPADDIGDAMRKTQGAIRSGSTFTGGTGKFARSFGSPDSANIYAGYVSRLFGSDATA